MKHQPPPALISLPLLAVLMAVWLVIGSVNYYHNYQTVLGAQTDLSAATVLALTNLERRQVDAAPLRLNDQLTQAAQAKAAHMLEHDYWDHTDPKSQTQPWFFIEEAGYAYQQASENLAKDFDSAEDLVQGWLDSPSHRANMLSQDYTETGVWVAEGEFQGSHTTLAVQLLAKPLSTNQPAVLSASKYLPASLLTPSNWLSLSLSQATAVLATISIAAIALSLAIDRYRRAKYRSLHKPPSMRLG